MDRIKIKVTLVAALAAGCVLGAPGAVFAQGSLINAYAPPAVTNPGDVRADGYGAYGYGTYGAVRSAPTSSSRASRSDQRINPSEPGVSARTISAPFQGR